MFSYRFISSNTQNDALLHRLVHTKLLSGSLNPELNLTHAQREKALSGRVLEVAGKTKLGKGEFAVRAEERNKASKRVREGLLRKKSEREKQQLEEVCVSHLAGHSFCKCCFVPRPKIWATTIPLLKNCSSRHLGRQTLRSESEVSEWEWVSLAGER
jgi:hypothetical protein